MASLMGAFATRLLGDPRRSGELIARWLPEGDLSSALAARVVELGETSAILEIVDSGKLAVSGDLELACGEPSLCARVPARLRGMKSGSEPGRIAATADFAIPLSEEIVQRLAVAGLLERRAYLRKPISLACEARPVEGPERPLHVRVLNYSPGGVLALCEEPLEAGTQLFLSAEGSAPFGLGALTLRVTRRTRRRDGWALGCEYESRTGFSRFESLLAESRNEDRLTSPSPWKWLTESRS